MNVVTVFPIDCNPIILVLPMAVWYNALGQSHFDIDPGTEGSALLPLVSGRAVDLGLILTIPALYSCIVTLYWYFQHAHLIPIVGVGKRSAY